MLNVKMVKIENSGTMELSNYGTHFGCKGNKHSLNLFAIGDKKRLLNGLPGSHPCYG
jgi:hypothetical protein